MPGLDDVISHGVGRHCGADGVGAVVGGNAGGHAFGRFDRHREVGAHARRVADHHRTDAQALAALTGEPQADQPARLTGHEIDVLGPHLAGGHDQIALVLAVFVIEDHHHAAGGDVAQDFGNAVEGHWALGENGRRKREKGKAESRRVVGTASLREAQRRSNPGTREGSWIASPGSSPGSQ